MLSRLRRILTAAIAAAAAICCAAATPRTQAVGLVLSGGGAKGIAHIGVIQALEENDIPIDYVAGTSMGAIVGALYAMGYTPDDMLRLITSPEFTYWSTGTIDPALTYYFNRPAPSPQMFSFSIGRTDSASAVPASLISPLPMNFEFMRLFSPYTAACKADFDSLMVPFRCVASDAEAKRPVTLARGDLGQCVRASMSFPGVFQPTEIDGRLLYDGGIYDNFPLDVMRDRFAPDIMIGVDVSSTEQGPQTSILAQLENLITAPVHSHVPPGEVVRLRLHLDRFGLLDFPKAREIYRIGYEHTIAHIDSIRARVTARTPAAARALRRAQFRARVPYLRFDTATVVGGTPAQNRYMAHLFAPASHHTDTFGIDHARQAYYRAISSGRIRDMRLTATQSDSTSLFALHARAWLRHDLQAAVGGYITSAANSYLYFGARATSLSFNSLEADAHAWIGQSYMAAAASARFYTPTRLPMALGIEAAVTRRNYYESPATFFDRRQPVHVIEKEMFARLKCTLAAARSGAIHIFAGAARLTDHFYRDNNPDHYSFGRDRAAYTLWQAGAQYSRSTIDAQNYPTAGAELHTRAMAAGGLMVHRAALSGLTAQRTHPAWLQAELRTRHYIPASRHFSLGLESDIMLSTRPLAANYNAAITAAPSFEPTPASTETFRPSFRANSFLAAGIIPVYRYSDALSARIAIYGFLPLRAIKERHDTAQAYYGAWLADPHFISQATIAYRLPFATIAGWGAYATGFTAGWTAGISFGIYLTAPRFLQL
ncbi:MAG: patatin-like phospholipase family protein [Muribaculaceae bacterium]|nr:patatin-like phospholipase family protein [Muribaculaceae bacterium]